jgi:hypothetical protein
MRRGSGSEVKTQVNETKIEPVNPSVYVRLRGITRRRPRRIARSDYTGRRPMPKTPQDRGALALRLWMNHLVH